MAADKKPTKITPEHQAILDRILPRMEEEKKRLQARKDAGEKWSDFASDKTVNETRDSADLVLSGVCNCGIQGEFVTTIGVDPRKDIRLARVIDKAFELLDKFPDQPQVRYNGILREERRQYGKYDEKVEKFCADIDAKYDKISKEKNPARKEKLNEELVKLENNYNTYYESRGKDKGGHHYEIQDYATNTLVCREYAAVSSMALHYGGIENYYTNGTVTFNGQSTGRHAYIVSKQSGNVLNVTALGSDIPIEHCYAKVVNKSADFKKGDTLIAQEADGTYTCYGTGKCQKSGAGSFAEIERYDKALIKKAQNGGFDHEVAPTNNIAQTDKKDTQKSTPAKPEHGAAAIKKELAQEWKFKNGVFEDHEGRKVKLTGEGNGKGYHFHDLGCSLVPQGKDKFTIFYADKSIKHEKIEIAEAKTTGHGKDDHGKINHGKDDQKEQHKPTGTQLVKQELKDNWHYKNGTFVSNDGHKVTASGQGENKAYHFHDLKCSLVPQKDGSFNIYVKDEHTGKAKLQGKMTVGEINVPHGTKSTAMLEEAAKLMQPLAEANKTQAKSFAPQLMADNSASRGTPSHQV